MSAQFGTIVVFMCQPHGPATVASGYVLAVSIMRQLWWVTKSLALYFPIGTNENTSNYPIFNGFIAKWNATIKFYSQWINGNIAVKHEIGHLPFETDVSQYLEFGKENRVTVLCDNALIQTTIPQGNIVEMAK